MDKNWSFRPKVLTFINCRSSYLYTWWKPQCWLKALFFYPFFLESVAVCGHEVVLFSPLFNTFLSVRNYFKCAWNLSRNILSLYMKLSSCIPVCFMSEPVSNMVCFCSVYYLAKCWGNSRITMPPARGQVIIDFSCIHKLCCSFISYVEISQKLG